MSLPRPGQAPFHLLTLGPFAESGVISTFDGAPMRRNSETEALIEQAWQARSKVAHERGQLLFPGPICRLSQWSVQEGELRLRFGPTNYRELVGTNLTHPELGPDLGAEFLSNGCGVLTVLITADEQFIVTRRNQRVFEYPGFLHVCGGGVAPTEREGQTIADPFAAIRQEIFEEIGLPASAIASLTCLGLGMDGLTLKPELLMQTRLNVPAAQIGAGPSEEHTSLQFIPADPHAVEAWTRERWDEIAPGALAGLVAYTACTMMGSLASNWRVGE